jgi:hypothetical protein
MNGIVYIVAWDSVLSNVLESEIQFNDIEYRVLNSSSTKVESDKWINIENIWYFNQFRLSLQDFSSTDKDFMCFLAGDLQSNQFSDIYKSAEKVFSDVNVGIYAPYFTHEAWSREITEIETVPGTTLVISTQTDGLMTFISRPVALEMLKAMNNVYKNNPEVESFRSGWGIDYTYCAISLMMNKLIYRDDSFYVTHPVGSSYNHGNAGQEMNEFIGFIDKYYKENTISAVTFTEAFEFIDRRRNGHREPLSNLYRNINKLSLAYTNMYIDDERKSSRDKSSAALSKWTDLDLLTVNVSNPGGYEKFSKSFPEFSTDRLLGERGNFSSHYLRWKYLLDSDLDNLLVIEDDAELDGDFTQVIESYMEYLPKDWDVFSIFVHENQFDRYTEKNNVPVVRAYQDWSTSCYLISRMGAKKMIDYVHAHGADYPTDWFIFRYASDRKLWDAYTIHPEFRVPVKLNQSYNSTVQL